MQNRGKEMNNYEINENTMAVISINEKESKVVEKDREYYINTSGYNIMDESCQYFGSSYQGRVDGSRAILNARYKLPIVVEDTNNLIFFPTESPDLESCSWLSLKDIANVIEENNETIILFKNGVKISVNVSKFSLDNQILRASRLEYMLRSRRSMLKS